jgi:hypothetical protein
MREVSLGNSNEPFFRLWIGELKKNLQAILQK